jgi:hypothetical protein
VASSFWALSVLIGVVPLVAIATMRSFYAQQEVPAEPETAAVTAPDLPGATDAADAAVAPQPTN